MPYRCQQPSCYFGEYPPSAHSDATSQQPHGLSWSALWRCNSGHAIVKIIEWPICPQGRHCFQDQNTKCMTGSYAILPLAISSFRLAEPAVYLPLDLRSPVYVDALT